MASQSDQSLSKFTEQTELEILAYEQQNANVRKRMMVLLPANLLVIGGGVWLLSRRNVAKKLALSLKSGKNKKTMPLLSLIVFPLLICTYIGLNLKLAGGNIKGMQLVGSDSASTTASQNEAVTNDALRQMAN